MRRKGGVAVDDMLVESGRDSQYLGGMLAHQWQRCKNSLPPAPRSLQYV